MKLSVKQAQVFTMGSMVLIMTMVVVLISTLVNFGLAPDFVVRFLRGWATAFVLAFPLVVLLMPRLHAFFHGLVEDGPHE